MKLGVKDAEGTNEAPEASAVAGAAMWFAAAKRILLGAGPAAAGWDMGCRFGCGPVMTATGAAFGMLFGFGGSSWNACIAIFAGDAGAKVSSRPLANTASKPCCNSSSKPAAA
jgi:hypothetical protein